VLGYGYGMEMGGRNITPKGRGVAALILLIESCTQFAAHGVCRLALAMQLVCKPVLY
jgi:hypothetical protein